MVTNDNITINNHQHHKNIFFFKADFYVYLLLQAANHPSEVLFDAELFLEFI